MSFNFGRKNYLLATFVNLCIELNTFFFLSKEILRENKEHLAQDEEGNVEMEFREFNQKSIDDLKSYVLSVTANNSLLQQKQQLPGGGSNPAPSMVATGSGGGNGGKDLSGHQNTTNDSDDSDSDDSSSSESSSDSESD